jgi:hypothetical protein
MERRRGEIGTHLAAAATTDLVQDGGAMEWAQGGAGPCRSARSEAGGSWIGREIDIGGTPSIYARVVEFVG